MRSHSTLPGWLLVAAIGAGAPGCLFVDEEETPLERKIVLQLDINPNQLKFKLGDQAAPEAATAPADADAPEPATDPAMMS